MPVFFAYLHVLSHAINFYICHYLPVCMCRDMLKAPICIVTYILLSSMCRDMPVLLPVCMCCDMLTAPICVVTYSLLSSMCRCVDTCG